MENFNQPSIIIISSEKILGILSDNWKKFTEIQKELKIDDMLDKRYLKLKLKELERKKLIESKNLAGNICYKKVESLHTKKSCSEKANRLPLTELSTEKTLETSSENWKNPKKIRNYFQIHREQHKQLVKNKKSKEKSFNYESYIIKINRVQKNIKVHKERLKKDPKNTLTEDLLKKAKIYLDKLKTELENHSYFVCLICKRVFKSKKELINHVDFKHNILAFNCVYCDDRFISESDLIAHEISHKLDLHGFYLKEAIKVVEFNLNKCKENKIKGLVLVHGYRHGNILRNYFRSESFIREMGVFGFEIEVIDVSKPGSTGIILKNL